MKKIIFIQSHNGGRLANQLWNFVSVYAYCLEKGYILINPTFDHYSKYFEQFKNNSFLSPNFKLNIFNKNLSWLIMRIILKINKVIGIGQSFQTGEDSNAIILPPTDDSFKVNKPVGFFNGWLFRNTDGLEKFRKEITHTFRPAKEYQIKIDNFLQTLSPDQFKVAIHIRRTDYKHHDNGKYYYEIEEYISVMKQIKAKYYDKNLLFIVFSDESWELSEFKDVGSAVMISPFLEDFVVDLFLISNCELIVGPPSSFTQFASWLGQKQLSPIESVANFKI